VCVCVLRHCGPHTPQVRAALAELEQRYAAVPKAPAAHPDLGDWWALYDYGAETVAAWPADYQHPYPGEQSCTHWACGLAKVSGCADQLSLQPLHVTPTDTALLLLS
jgi:hypothetical protein